MALLRGYLYVITDERREFAHVGMARDVHAKLCELKAGCPMGLRLESYHPCSHARMREVRAMAALRGLHLHDGWLRWDKERIEAAIASALALPAEELRLPSQRHAYPVRRIDTGEVFLNASEAALAVLGSRKLAPKIRLAIKIGCKCGPTTWAWAE